MTDVEGEAGHTSHPANFLVMLLLFLSGLAALVYEIVWLRHLTLTLGKTTFSISIVLAAFMGGIALGNIIFGRVADRLKRPLMAFGWLELSIAGSGVLLVALFTVLNPVYRWFISSTGLPIDSTAALALKPIIAFVVLTLQTVFMGGTLPILSRHVVRTRQQLGSGVGLIYALNTLGAVIGCLLAGFVLLPKLGADPSVWLVIGINTAVGITALIIGRHSVLPQETQEQSSEAPSTTHEFGWRFFLVAYFITGTTALAYEVLWTRQLVFFVGNDSYAFTLMLTTFLLGLSLGSYVYARSFDAVANGLRMFGFLQMGIGVSALAGIGLLYQLSYYRALLTLLTGAHTWEGIMLVKAALAFTMMVVPTFLLGMAFPLVNRLAIPSLDQLGRGLAALTASNGLGGILGSMLAGSILLPWLGINRSLVIIATFNIALGAWTWAGKRTGYRRPAIAGVTAWAVSLALGLLIVAWLPPILFAGTSHNQREVIHHREGVDATLSVMTSPKGSRMLDINGAVTAADTFTDVVVHRLLAHGAMLLHPKPAKTLVVGFGLGITAHSATTYAETERVDIVELVEDEQYTAPFFRHYNKDVLHRDNVNLLIGDGRDYIGTTAERYDVISFNAIHPRLGAGLYTEEFYALCKGALRPGGLVAGWLPTNWMTDVEFRSLVKTFQKVFPQSTLWYINPAHMVIVGGADPVRIDVAMLRARLASGAVRDDLADSYMADLDSYLSHFLMGPAGMQAYTAGVPINTDSHSAVEYARAVTAEIQPGIVEALLEAREPIGPYLEADELLSTEVLERAFEATGHLIAAELFHWRYSLADLAKARISKAMALNPQDPYIQYIAFGYGAHREKQPVRRPAADPADVMFALETAGDSAVFFNKGSELLRQGELPSAIESLETAVGLRPDYAAAYNNLGYAYAKLELAEPALSAFNNSIAVAPQGWLPYYHKGNVLLGLENQGDAMKSFEMAVDNNPYYAQAWSRLEWLYTQNGKQAQALQARQQLAGLSSGAVP